jgi:anti-sigma28 factor (negative regulator of flagellin synthesis)
MKEQEGRKQRADGRFGATLTVGDRGKRLANPVTDASARTMHLTILKARIARSDYAVDPHAVADALLRSPDPRRAIALPPLARLVDAGKPPVGSQPTGCS